MDLKNRSISSIVRRTDAMAKWDDSDTGKASSTRTLQQITIRFEFGTMLLAAVTAGDTNETLRLLKEGADVNYANVDGLTCLHQACIDENFAMVKILVDNGANIDACDNEGWTPLHAAASSSSLEIIKYLVSKGANIVAVNSEGELPVDLVENQQIERFFDDELRRRGIDVDEAREAEEKLMMRDVEKWKRLGRIDDIRDVQGATPLHVAASKDYLDVAKELLAIGADPNARDKEGWTPLHAAVHWKNTDICKELLEKGADPNALNENGEPPIKLADSDTISTLQKMFDSYMDNASEKGLKSNQSAFSQNSQKSKTKEVVGILKSNKKESYRPEPAVKPGILCVPRPYGKPKDAAKTTSVPRPGRPAAIPDDSSANIMTPTKSSTKVARPSPTVCSTQSTKIQASSVRPPTSITKPDLVPLPPKKIVTFMPLPVKEIDDSFVTNEEKSDTPIAAPDNKDTVAIEKIICLEKEISDLKKEREILLKIIDNLKSQIKEYENQPKPAVKKSPGASGKSPSVARPPPTRQ